jgi:hypothetical protein
MGIGDWERPEEEGEFLDTPISILIRTFSEHKSKQEQQIFYKFTSWVAEQPFII